MGEVFEEVEAMVVPERKPKESSINRETDYSNVRTMDEDIEADAVTEKQNKEVVESEVLSEGASGEPDDIDVDTIVHPSANVGTMDNDV